jgi:hypothetical protein
MKPKTEATPADNTQDEAACPDQGPRAIRLPAEQIRLELRDAQRINGDSQAIKADTQTIGSSLKKTPGW